MTNQNVREMPDPDFISVTGRSYITSSRKSSFKTGGNLMITRQGTFD